MGTKRGVQDDGSHKMHTGEKEKQIGNVHTTSPLHLTATSKASPSTPLNLGRITDKRPWPLLF